jgi:rod shape-determining protein MreD
VNAVARAALAALLLLLAAGFQGTLAPRLFAAGGQPDLVLAAALTLSLLSGPTAGALLGFAAGLLGAALSGETVGTLLVSRTLAGFVGGAFGARLLRPAAPAVALGVFAATLAGEAVYILAAPRVGAARWAAAAVVGAAWNVLLALPTMVLLRRLGWDGGQDDAGLP